MLSILVSWVHTCTYRGFFASALWIYPYALVALSAVVLAPFVAAASIVQIPFDAVAVSSFELYSCLDLLLLFCHAGSAITIDR